MWVVIVFDYGFSLYVVFLGFVFYIGSFFFEVYCGGVFVGEYGSWNCKELNGYKVVFICFDEGYLVGGLMDFIMGFVKDG